MIKLIKIFVQMILLFCFSALFLSSLSFVFRKGYVHLKVFKEKQCSYQKLRKCLPGASIGIKVKKVLPVETTVTFSNGLDRIPKIAARYQLYPIKVEKEGSFFLDWNYLGDGSPPKENYREIEPGVLLFSRKQVAFSDVNQPQLLSFFKTVAFVFFWTFLNVFAGGTVLFLTGMSFSQAGKGCWLAMSYLVGYFLFTSILWAFLLCGGQLLLPNIIILWGLLFSGLVIFYLKAFGVRSLKVKESFKEVLLGLIPSQISWVKVFMFLIWGIIFFITISIPVKDWDAMSHWILKAKVFYHQQGLFFDYTHLNVYPLLWPLNIAAQFSFVGGMYDQVAGWTSALFFLSCLFVLRGTLKILRVKDFWGDFAMTCYAVILFHYPFSPAWDVRFIQSNAENIFMAYLSAVIFCFLSFGKNLNKKSALFIVLCLGAALCLTKLEGSFSFSVILFSAIICLMKRKVFDRRNLFYVLLMLFSLTLPLFWGGWLKQQGYSLSTSHFHSGVSSYKIYVLALLNIVFIFHNPLVYISFYGFVYGKLYMRQGRWTDITMFLFFVSVGLILFSMVSYLGLPAEKIKAFFPEVFPRLLLHSAPALLLLWGERFLPKND